MSMGSGKSARNAEIARQNKLDTEEAARKERITQGQAKIDENFGQFDQAYYDRLNKDYLEYYNPLIDRQYDDTRQKLIYGLAEAGGLESTAGTKQIADLLEGLNQRRGEIAQQGQSAVDQRRAEIEATKSDLYNMNRSAADPSSAGTQALARAGTFNGGLETSPLGDLFSSFLTNLGGYMGGRQKNNMGGGGGFSPGGGNPSGSGTGTVRR